MTSPIFFTNKITLIREQIQLQYESMNDTVDQEMLHSTIHQSKLSDFTKVTDKTCNLDAIPTSLLKKAVHAHLPHLVDIVNSNFSEGYFPERLKTAFVTPLLKKDNLDVNIMKNYMLVSSIPFIIKVLEKITVKQLLEQLTTNGFQEEYQSAYRAAHSTETALLRVHNDLKSALDRNQAVVFVMLDFSAAFKTNNQDQLITLLNEEFGVAGNALSWLRTYLKQRTQRVKIGQATSDHTPLESGVPLILLYFCKLKLHCPPPWFCA